MTPITQLWKQTTRRSLTGIALLLTLALAASACGASPTIAAGEAASGGANADSSSAITPGSITNDPPVPVVPTVEVQVAATPEWWSGCDDGNFVLEGFDPNVVFTALGEPAAESVKLSDNPLGVGLITDCRAFNGETRVSIIAVPPIGGLTESVDFALGSEEGAEERTIAGNRSAVYAEVTGLFPSGSVQINVDVYTIIVNVEDRDSRRFSEAQLKQLAVTAAEAFLSQV